MDEAPAVMTGRPGQVFVINGDLTKIACDAWMLPTDSRFHVTEAWTDVVSGLTDDRGCLVGRDWHDTSIGGDGRVQPLEAAKSTDAPRIWLGNIGAVTDDPVWYTDALHAFVAAAVTDARTRAKDRPPRLAVSLIGSGQGGFFARKGALVDRLVRTAYDAVEEFDVDLVIVTWGSKQYSALQQARRSLLEETTQLDPRLKEQAIRLAAFAREGQLVLFVGAGASADVGISTWQELLTKLARDRRFTTNEQATLRTLDLRDQAAIVKRRFDRPADFDAALRPLLASAKYTLVQGLLGSLPVKEAVTTNFDTLLETAMATAGRTVAVLPAESPQAGERWLLKLHGSLDDETGVVLSRADYHDLALRHGALFGLVQALLMTRHMLFVGYSLKDEDFHQLVHEVDRHPPSLAEPGR